MPECRRQLVEDASETDDPTLVGENCHIVADKDDGPRGDPTMSVEDRNRYANLILLCCTDHKIIDDQVANWPVERLKDLKREHETWVKQALGLDPASLRDDTVYAGYVDHWEKLAHVDGWKAWSSYVLGSGQPRMARQLDSDLEELRAWLVGRIWPERYPSLEAAFGNFGLVLQDFQEMFREHAEPMGNQAMLWTRKFYRVAEGDPKRHADLVQAYEAHVDIVSDLMLELTRAGNLICDEVRRHLSPSYRINEGRLMVQRGPDMQLRWVEFVPRYSQAEAQVAPPYPGLDAFYDQRARRDWAIGAGKPA
jgi:hypothetical protein